MRSYQNEKASQLLLRFHRRKSIVQKSRYELWRGIANLLGFGVHERLRVAWIVFYYTAGKESAALTAKHFGISGKTFHKWSRRFEDSKYNVKNLASKAPTTISSFSSLGCISRRARRRSMITTTKRTSRSRKARSPIIRINVWWMSRKMR